MKQTDYPALFQTADATSNRAQRIFLNLMRLEYTLLVVASILAMNWSTSIFTLVGSAVVFVVLILLLLARSLRSFDKNWYHARAVAESVKTLTWRYMMKASPFIAPTEADTDAEFRRLLSDILRSNKAFAEIANLVVSPATDQITAFMREIRALSFEDRKAHYLKQRVDEQMAWYQRSARRNTINFRTFATILVAAYLAAGISTLIKIKYPDFIYYPTEPLIAVAAGLIGWVQLKKYNELGAAYALTALEIGLIKTSARHVATDDTFSEFINDAEMAFSREHTQWIARQAG